MELIKTSLAEFPGTFLALALIDRLGRRRTLAALAGLFAVASLLVMECSLGKGFLVAVLFGARGFAAGFFQSVYVYTPEVYPTRLRAVALGIGSTCARVGAMITPFVAQVLLKSSLYTAMLVYAALGKPLRYTFFINVVEIPDRVVFTRNHGGKKCCMLTCSPPHVFEQNGKSA